MDSTPPPHRPKLSGSFWKDRPPPPPRPAPSHLPMVGLAAMLLMLLVVIAGAVIIGFRTVESDATPSREALAVVRAAAARQPATGALPVPAPVELLPITPDDARKINAAVPFSRDPVPAARPLRLALPPADQARATDCLAAALWYEAGNDMIGQQAVGQVVLNRMRHPAFPHTVCGVVFQGSERATGCQFSFTCDGAMATLPPPELWERARANAAAALAGLVFSPVGYATHYHTDWVVPNWSASVDKIAAVHTHLFFRWRGNAGKPAAFTGRHQGPEPTIRKLIALSPAHAGLGVDALAVDKSVLADTGAGPAPARKDSAPAPVDAPPPATLRGNALAQSAADSGLFVIRIASDTAPGSLALVALDLCRARSGKACTVVGYSSEPGAVTSDGARTRWDKSPDFYYFSDPSRGRETVFWNCDRYPRPKPQCLPDGYVAAG